MSVCGGRMAHGQLGLEPETWAQYNSAPPLEPGQEGRISFRLVELSGDWPVDQVRPFPQCHSRSRRICRWDGTFNLQTRRLYRCPHPSPSR